MMIHQSKPPPRKCGASLQFRPNPADFGKHTEIALQGVPNRDYTLRLFTGNMALELQTQDNQTWTPAQPLYVSCFFITNTE